MSRVVTNTDTLALFPTSHIDKTVDGSWYSLTNVANAYKAHNQDTSTYCNIGLTRGANAYTYIYFTFDTSSIPLNATIDSISCVARVQITTQRTSYIASKGAVMCSGTTEKTAAVSVTTSAANRTFSMGTWTRSEVSDVRLKMYATRASANTAQGYNLRLYGATLTIGYTYDNVYYTVTSSISIPGASISPASDEYLAGDDAVITISGTNVPLAVDDNGNDVSSQVVASGSDYIYTIYSIAADHIVAVSQGVAPIPSQTIYVKQNGTWKQVDKMFVKQNGNWIEVEELSLKQNGNWVN